MNNIWSVLCSQPRAVCTIWNTCSIQHWRVYEFDWRKIPRFSSPLSNYSLSPTGGHRILHSGVLGPWLQNGLSPPPHPQIPGTLWTTQDGGFHIWGQEIQIPAKPEKKVYYCTLWKVLSWLKALLPEHSGKNIVTYLPWQYFCHGFWRSGHLERILL